MSAVLVTGPTVHCYTELAISSLVMAITFTSTHFAYSQRNGQAAWPVSTENLLTSHSKVTFASDSQFTNKC